MTRFGDLLGALKESSTVSSDDEVAALCGSGLSILLRLTSFEEGDCVLEEDPLPVPNENPRFSAFKLMERERRRDLGLVAGEEDAEDPEDLKSSEGVSASDILTK